MGGDSSKTTRELEYETHADLFGRFPGATDLVAAYDGWAPDFHDAVLGEIKLSSGGVSSLTLRSPFPNIFSPGWATVTLTIGEVVDLELNHFISDTNIIFRVILRRPIFRPERVGHRDRPRRDELEIDIEASVGIAGYLVVRELSVAWRKE